MLTLNDVVIRYGSAVAVDGVSLSVERGEMVALVGPNGAGKSSLVNAISGVVPVASGSIRLDARSAQVPEGRQMFADMSVEDNLRLGAWKSKDRDPAPIYEMLPDLQRLRRQKAGTLSGGQQQMVAVGRALMAKPELLLIDELSLGLAPLVVAGLADHLQKLNREHGTTILLIEQEIALAFRLCERAYVLEAGRIVASGESAELALDPALRDAYLGGEVGGTPRREDAS
ncbi:ABC transporter ATP-binding protein [Microbacterium sp. STN6]|uniref:ABC transporter ATP-binding protein n=1 Tax=Microbacterium sp. STN6 TaxID=2995588 RepID=UPI002260F40F|nr:ABC transporter ATP-binding protein [Microbacterium sp. STN6]MCX7523300.1 ABC transporter ATP-binding protein [Microbacterium sp. STN6]